MIGSCYEELIKKKKDFAKPDDDLRAEKPKRVKKIEKNEKYIYNMMMARQKSKAEASTKNVVFVLTSRVVNTCRNGTLKKGVQTK